MMLDYGAGPPDPRLRSLSLTQLWPSIPRHHSPPEPQKQERIPFSDNFPEKKTVGKTGNLNIIITIWSIRLKLTLLEFYDS